jgi:hypothetical protein
MRQFDYPVNPCIRSYNLVKFLDFHNQAEISFSCIQWSHQIIEQMKKLTNQKNKQTNKQTIPLVVKVSLNSQQNNLTSLHIFKDQGKYCWFSRCPSSKTWFFCWCPWDSEWRVKCTQTWKRGPPSEPAEIWYSFNLIWLVVWLNCWLVLDENNATLCAILQSLQDMISFPQQLKFQIYSDKYILSNNLQSNIFVPSSNIFSIKSSFQFEIDTAKSLEKSGAFLLRSNI